MQIVPVRALALLACLALCGCVTSVVRQLAEMPSDASHRVDRAVSAFTLPDGNLVIFVKGRLRGTPGESEFSLLVPRAELDRLKTKVADRRHTDNYFQQWYDAPVGPSSDYQVGDWRPMPVERRGGTLDSYTYANLPPTHVPMLYEVPEDEGIGKYWGKVDLLYVEAYPDGAAFRVEISPQVTLVKGSATKWLPLTIPADVATLPAQALWGVLFLLQAQAK